MDFLTNSIVLNPNSVHLLNLQRGALHRCLLGLGGDQDRIGHMGKGEKGRRKRVEGQRNSWHK